VTCLVYYLSFRKNLLALSLLIAYLFVLNAVIATSDVFSESFPSISSYRGISALAIVPLMHLMMCVFHRIQWRSGAALGGAIQTFIFVFVVWSRSSAQWGVVAIAIYTLLTWLLALRSKSARTVPLWPLLAVLVGFLGLKVYVSQAVSPAYYTDDLVTGHLVWHSAYIGLTLNPHFPDTGYTGDGIAFEPATKYLRETRPDLHGSGSLTNGYRFRLHDQAVRHLFLEFAFQNPLFMVQLYFWWKPLQFISNYGTAMRVWFQWMALLPIIVTVSVTGALSAKRLGDDWYRWCGGALSVTSMLLLGSYLPLWWAYAAPYVMSDSILAATLWLIVVAWALTGTAYLQASERWPHRLRNMEVGLSTAIKSLSSWLSKLRLEFSKEQR